MDWLNNRTHLGVPIQKLQDLTANRKVLSYLAIALVAQVLFWHFSMPGPQLHPEYQPGFAAASWCCLIAVLCLLVLPLSVVLVRRDSFRRLGLDIGDFKFGIKAVLVVAPIFVFATVVGSGDLQMQRFYPMPGPAIGSNLGQYFAWIVIYACYYFSFEFFYRGFLLRGPEDLGLANCFVLSLFCCVMIHFGKPLAETLAAIPASIVFAWVAIRSRSIYYALAIHFLVGIANDLAILWQRGA